MVALTTRLAIFASLASAATLSFASPVQVASNSLDSRHHSSKEGKAGKHESKHHESKHHEHTESSKNEDPVSASSSSKKTKEKTPALTLPTASKSKKKSSKKTGKKIDKRYNEFDLVDTLLRFSANSERALGKETGTLDSVMKSHSLEHDKRTMITSLETRHHHRYRHRGYWRHGYGRYSHETIIVKGNDLDVDLSHSSLKKREISPGRMDITRGYGRHDHDTVTVKGENSHVTFGDQMIVRRTDVPGRIDITGTVVGLATGKRIASMVLARSGASLILDIAEDQATPVFLVPAELSTASAPTPGFVLVQMQLVVSLVQYCAAFDSEAETPLALETCQTLSPSSGGTGGTSQLFEYNAVSGVVRPTWYGNGSPGVARIDEEFDDCQTAVETVQFEDSSAIVSSTSILASSALEGSSSAKLLPTSSAVMNLEVAVASPVSSSEALAISSFTASVFSSTPVSLYKAAETPVSSSTTSPSIPSHTVTDDAVSAASTAQLSRLDTTLYEWIFVQ